MTALLRQTPPCRLALRLLLRCGEPGDDGEATAVLLTAEDDEGALGRFTMSVLQMSTV